MLRKVFHIKANSIDLKYIENIYYFMLLSICCILLINLMSSFCEIQAFRHDELKYIDSYFTKLVTEGRWLNYLFFSTLKISNVKIMAVVNVISFFYIFLYMFFKYTREKICCAMCNSFSFYSSHTSIE